MKNRFLPAVLRIPLRLAAACALLAPLAARADAKLKVGDPAPALALKKFVKGEPVKAFEKGKVYVVEFWATWCGPCRESIPHLTELQKANPEITFIGVDVGEDEKEVEPFVAKMGDQMNYRVALDDLSSDPEGATNTAFMTAADQNGIPAAFIVDKDSKIAWIDHPMAIKPILAQIAAGAFDVKKAAADKADLIAVQTKMRASDFDGAIKKMDELIAADPAKVVPLGVMQFEALATYKEDAAAAARKAEEIIAKVDDSQTLNNMAWTLATANETTPAILATAKKLSEKSLIMNPGAVECLDTLARIYAAGGDFPKAVELQTQAVEKADHDPAKSALTETLDAYKAGKIPAA